MILVRRPVALAAALTLGVLPLAGCSGALGNGDSTVVAAFYPLAWVSEQVAGEHYDVVDLTTPGAEPHDLELSIRQTAQVAGAALVVHESGVQPAVDEAVATQADGRVVDAAEVVALRATGMTDEHDHGGEEAEHSAGGDEVDLHFWLDPLLMADLAEAVATELGRLDPEHADDYDANAAAVSAELTALDRDYSATLGQCDRSTIVVNHGAFGYLARYGLDIHSIAGLSPTAEPSAATLAELREVIEHDGITTVFTETLASPKNAEALASSTGVETAVLDPIEGLTEDSEDEDYLSLMRRNLTALAEANGC